MKYAFLAIAGLAFFAAIAEAQSTALLTGTVIDPTGAVVPHIQVQCRNVDTDWKATVLTNSSGLFRFPDVPVGSYELTVSGEGFATLLRGGVKLLTGQTADLTLSLRLGQTSQSVEVSAPAPIVQSTTSDLGTTVDSREMSDLPLNGRNAFDLALLTAGAVGTDASTLPGQAENTGLAVNGLRAVDNNWQLDGASYTNRMMGSAPTLPNPDTLQEFSARTSNFDASNRGAGASVKLTTRSGTNQFHGTMFEFLRNNAMDARNFFSIQTEPYKLNQYGATLGGPIKRDRLFFFGSYQGTNQRGGPSPRSMTVPDALERTGNYSQSGKIVVDPLSKGPFPGNVIPGSRLDSIAQALMKYIPLPNYGANTLFLSPAANRDDAQWLGKIDYLLSSKDRITGRYFYDHNAGQRDVNSLPDFFPTNRFTNQTALISETHTFGPSWLMMASFNYLRTFRTETPTAPTTMQQLGANVPFADAGAGGNKMYVSVSGYTYWWSGVGSVMHPATAEPQVEFSYASGRHFVRFGSSFRRNTSDSLNRVNNDAGYWTYTAARTTSSSVKNSGDAFASFLLGLPATFTENSSTPNDFRLTNFDGWIQDDWKATARLTLNVGLRYEPWLPPHDADGPLAGFLPGRQSQVAPLAPAGLVFGGDPGIPQSIARDNWNTFGPRFGFAWDAAGNGKTVVRGGYGIFRFSSDFFGLLYSFADTVPFRSESVSFTNPVSTADPYQGHTDPYPFTPSSTLSSYKFTNNLAVDALDPNARGGYAQSWNFTVERQVARDAAVSVSYVGNHALGIMTRYADNPAIYGPGATTGNENSRRLYKSFADIIMAGTSPAYSNFESLQVQVTKRAARGLSVLLNYTYGKAMSIDSSGSMGAALGEGPRDPLNFRLDYGPADYDVTHQIKGAAIYTLPVLRSGPKALKLAANGWQINSILTLRGGFPFTCRSGVDNSLSGIGNDTCDQINPNSARPAGANFMTEWFNTAAFTRNAIGTFGSAGRNDLRRPGVFNVDLSLFRTVRITEKLRAELRAEAFNAFNHPNFDLFYNASSYTASEDVTSPTLGQITHAQDPRLLQAAVKLRF